MSDEDKNKKITRRDFMVLSANSMAAVGGACALWPMVESLLPAENVVALASIEVDISGVEQGSTLTVKWRGKPVFIRNRTQEEMTQAKSVALTALIDQQPDSARVKAGHENWLVVIGSCTHLGCVPLANQGDYGGWLCPCHGSQYDVSGRVRKGPAPTNLEVPPYEFISETKIKIG